MSSKANSQRDSVKCEAVLPSVDTSGSTLICIPERAASILLAGLTTAGNRKQFQQFTPIGSPADRMSAARWHQPMNI